MDIIPIAIAFIFGLLAQQIRMPPMVGFILAGFVLRAMGQQSSDELKTIADLGVTLLLFTIGLKLELKTLCRREVWAGTSLHTLLVLLLLGPIIFGIAMWLGPAIGLDLKTALLLAFACSFSSTVFAIKTLGESGELGSIHGQTAVGILVMQDIIAVLFLTFSSGKFPSWLALLLVPALVLGRPVLGWFIQRTGRGELMALLGLVLALVVGAKLFDLVGLKADLGALFIGIMVGWHPRASELKKSLSNLTDLLLVGFFLQIGLSAELTTQSFIWAGVLLLLLPLKSIGFFLLLTCLQLRARTSWMAAASLSTYSEFGLIVASIGVAKGWLGADWLVTLALALSFSFLIVAPFYRRAESMYDRWSDGLKRFERPGKHRGDFPALKSHERVAIFGMGRVGLASYHALEFRFPGHIIGFDRNPERVKLHRQVERNVRTADATDSDFWERIAPRDQLDLVILAMPSHQAHLQAIETLKRHNFEGVVIVSAKRDNELKELRKAGVDAAFNLYDEAGAAFAKHTFQVFEQQRPDLVSAWQDAGDLREESY